MLALIIPVFLILIGIFLIVFKQKTTKSVTISKDTPAQTSADQSKKEELKPTLEELTIPGNFPSEIVFYFGSQTGTSEKFCGILEEEA
jgi:uncharacterized membrane protein